MLLWDHMLWKHAMCTLISDENCRSSNVAGILGTFSRTHRDLSTSTEGKLPEAVIAAETRNKRG